ncbi:MAG TPA: GAP family protein [Thermomicrobiales bacterium]|nr:GAP family protein [Thermomicrobiales bacterium]
MGPALAEVAQAAVGVALVNPLPIMAVIVLLFSPRAAAAAPAFVIGWLLGLIVVFGLLLFVFSPNDAMGSERSPSTLASVIQIGLGLLLFGLAVRRWQGRPRPGEEPKTPRWMAALEQAAPPAALGLGALLSGVNPKNWPFTIAAAIAIAEAQPTVGQSIAPLFLFALVASVGVATPVIWHSIAPERAGKTLAGWRVWLNANYATIMVVIFVFFGVKLFTQGLGGLIG